MGTQVSPALVSAVIGIESAGNAQAVSSSGAVGLMQLIPATADRFGVKDSTDPVQNIKGGVAYLDWLMTQFDRDPLMVLAAYKFGRELRQGQRRCAAFQQDARLRAEGTRGLGRGAWPVRDAAGAGD